MRVDVPAPGKIERALAFHVIHTSLEPFSAPRLRLRAIFLFHVTHTAVIYVIAPFILLLIIIIIIIIIIYYITVH